jgi:hypothetical protein
MQLIINYQTPSRIEEILRVIVLGACDFGASHCQSIPHTFLLASTSYEICLLTIVMKYIVRKREWEWKGIQGGKIDTFLLLHFLPVNNQIRRCNYMSNQRH